MLSNTQIVSLYDSDEQMTVEGLAQAFGLEVTTVKLALAGGSQRYRKEVQDEPEVFTEDDAKLAAATIKQLCYAENEGVRLKAAVVMLDEKRGRRNPMKNAKKIGQLNITILNAHLQKAEESLARLENMKNAITI